jgi:hypothetical protein
VLAKDIGTSGKKLSIINHEVTQTQRTMKKVHDQRTSVRMLRLTFRAGRVKFDCITSGRMTSRKRDIDWLIRRGVSPLEHVTNATTIFWLV